MTAQEYLSYPRMLAERMERLIRVQAFLRGRGENERAQQLSPDILKLEKERAHWRKRVEGRLALLPDEQERFALSLRYLEGMRSEDIAETMSYCERQIYRILKRGLMHIDYLLAS